MKNKNVKKCAVCGDNIEKSVPDVITFKRYAWSINDKMEHITVDKEVCCGCFNDIWATIKK